MIKVMATPRTVDLELTSRCNLRCRYCYYMRNDGVSYDDMPTDRWLALLKELGQAKVMEVCLSGGEALLRPDVFELIDAVVRNRMRFQLLTNGGPVTTQVARRLKATGRCNVVQVSLDGSRAEIHETLRGQGSFAPALNAIKILLGEGVPTTVRATIHVDNIEDLPVLADLLLDQIGLPSFSTNAISSLGSRAKYGDNLFLSPAMRLRAMHVLADLDARYPGRIQASAGPLGEWKMFHRMEAARRKGDALPGRGCLTGCGCIYNKLAVRADGAFIPCVTLPQMVLGYVGRDSIEHVWQNAPQLHALRERTHIPLTEFERCRECDYNRLCTGNCPGTAVSAGGDANQPAEEGCLALFQQALAAEDLSLW